MRAKGFLVVAFVESDGPGSEQIIAALTDWTTVSPKLAVVVVASGERSDAETLSTKTDALLFLSCGTVTAILPLYGLSPLFLPLHCQ